MKPQTETVTIFVISLFVLFTFAQQKCFSSLEFTTGNQKIWVNGLPYNLKGINWDGFSTSKGAWDGLNYHNYRDILSWLKDQGFNTIRLMYHLDLVIYDQQPSAGTIDYNKNPDLKGLSSMKILETVVRAGADYGIFFMLDMHSFKPYIWDIYDGGMWYDSTHSEADVLRCWDLLMERFADAWNVIGMDLKNEPYNSTWGTGNLKTDWNLAAERIGNHIHSQSQFSGSRYLIFVEGNWDSPVCPQNCFWGEDLIGVRKNPILLNQKNKLVYSAHSYGPPGQTYFNATNFPNNMPSIWEDHYGFIPALTGVPVMVGETRIGGFGPDPPNSWQWSWFTTFCDWLVSKQNITVFYFVIEFPNGNSYYPGADILSWLNKIQPHPTRVLKTESGQYCISEE
eukprot:TRINITY_DN7342_c0_g1_i1.p1 TRINITY_DN7342_c0_g1~~TRINITY_DN7342_c0_g1_i1.p1  ORF type:complete len:405 (-),score=65.40 TRINITY_DN7342_c0_g1_i1:77-1264(-)